MPAIELGMGRRNSKRRPSTPAIEANTSNLPREIMYTIFLKLSAKSIIQCKCVCKSWRTLLTGPEFVKTHLTQSIQLDRKRIFCYNHDQFFFVDCELPANYPKDELYFPFPVKRFNNRFDMNVLCCSCNGLVLVGFDVGKNRVLYLWNPLIRALKKISFCPIPLIQYYDFYGLCYSPSTNGNYEYKIVIGTDQNYFVFRFKTNSWTEALKTTFQVKERRTTCVNGAPHWYAQHPKQRKNLIVYFDGVDENFKDVPFPPLSVCDAFVYTSANIRGCLGICAENKEARVYEVWVMEEYGNKESWTMMFTLPKMLGPPCLLELWCPIVLGLTEKGEVIIHIPTSCEVVIYDPVKKRAVRKIRCDASLVCFDSLVTPSAAGLKLVRKRKSVEICT